MLYLTVEAAHLTLSRLCRDAANIHVL